jgi:signal transduction histidine kinase
MLAAVRLCRLARSPGTSADGPSYLALLQRKGKDQIDDQARQYIISAAVDGARMRELIDDLLEYSRVDSKGKEFVDVDLKEVVGRTLSLL